MSRVRKFLPASPAQAIFSFCVALLTCLIGTLCLPPLLMNGHQIYADLIASGIAVADVYKSGDIHYALALTALTLGSFFLAVPLGRRIWPEGRGLQAREPGGADGALDFLVRTLLFYFSLAGALALLGFLRGPLGLSARWDLFALGMASLLAWWSGRRPLLLNLASFLVPLLLFRFLAVDVWASGDLVRVGPNGLFRGLGFFLLGLSWVAGVRARKEPLRLLPFHAAWISAYLVFRLPEQSIFALDSYHTGEMLIPFQQVFRWGLSYYGDFVSVHGLLAVMHGLVNALFFAGAYGTADYAFTLFDSLAAAVLSVSLFLALPARFAFLLSLFVLPSWNRFDLFPFVLAVLSAAPLWRRPALWAFTAVALGTFALFFNHAPGLGIALALAPWVIYSFWRSDRREQKWFLLGTVLLLAAVAWPLTGVFQFVRENGRGTLEGFGLSISQPPRPPSVLRSLPLPVFGLELIAQLFKAFKLYGWLVGILGLLASLAWRGREQARVLPEWFVVGFTLLFSASLIPYTFGRVGVEGLDRVGALSVLVLGFCLPFLLTRDRKKASWLLLFFLFFGLGLRVFPYLKDFRAPVSFAASSSAMPAGVQWYANVPEVKNLGGAFARSEEIAAQAEFGQSLSANLPGNEGYFDFTNNQSYFLVHDRPAAYAYPSHILQLNQALQKKVIEKLNAHPPTLVWVAPSVRHEHYSAALRSYRVYRWLMERGYVDILPSDHGGFQFLRRVENPAKLGSRAAGLIKFFLDERLGQLPRAWGRNWERFRPRFRPFFPEVAQETEGNRVTLTFAQPFAGKQADFLLLDFASMEGGEVEVRFRDPSGNFISNNFVAARGGGRYLFPLGADPRWLQSGAIESLTLEFKGPSSPAVTPSFHRLVQ